MSKSNKKKIQTPACDCGPLKPVGGDRDVTGQSADQVLAKVMLTCDDDTGVFFFRHGGKLYFRRVASE